MERMNCFAMVLINTFTELDNLVERWFAEISRKRIRRGTFRSVPDLIRAIGDSVTHHNRHAEPFIWTATAGRPPPGAS